MKFIFLTFTFLVCIGCKNKPKKVIHENLKTKNEIILLENNETRKNSKSLIIPFDKYQIEFIAKKNNLEFLKKPRFEKDTLFIFGPDITELESIGIKNLELNEFRVFQKYEVSLFLQLDGKTFEMKNWEKFKSGWFNISNGENIKTYSENEYKKIPKYSTRELFKAIEINKKTISEHWYNFVIENLDKKDSEVFFESIINKTIFKIVINKKQNIFVVFEHMIGC